MKASPEKIIAMREWRKKNKDKTRARSKKVHERHMEKMATDPEYRASVKEKERNYRIQNREKIRAYGRDYWQKNRDACKVAASLGIPISEARKMLTCPKPKFKKLSLPAYVNADGQISFSGTT